MDTDASEMPGNNSSELQKLLTVIDKIVVEISRQRPQVTINSLWDLILKKVRLSGNHEYWSTQLSLLLVVRRLFKEGLAVGRIESGSLLHGTKIFFDVDANLRLLAEIQSANTQNIKRTVLDLGTKFTRLQVAEIAENCNVTDEVLIVETILDMIARHQVDAHRCDP